MTQIKSDPRIHNRPKPVKVEAKVEAEKPAKKAPAKKKAK